MPARGSASVADSCSDVLFEAARRFEQAAADVRQVVEVNRPFLVVLRDLRLQDRQHRLAGDTRFEKRAGVEPDDGRRVVQRVEVVVLRRGVDRMAPEEPDVLELRQIDLLPLVEPSWMRPDEQARLPEHGIGAAANVLNPAFGESRLVRGVLEQRRADVQDVGPRRVEARVLAELFARARRLTAEPLVVALRAGHDNPLGRHTMQLDGLRFCVSFQTVTRSGIGAQQRLAGQVIPAADAEHRPQTRARARSGSDRAAASPDRRAA